MLNSAHFVMLPFESLRSPKAPPIIETSLICPTVSGNVAKHNATFVNVPVATITQVPFGVFMIALYIANTAFSGCTLISAGGFGRRVVPSIPESP